MAVVILEQIGYTNFLDGIFKKLARPCACAK